MWETLFDKNTAMYCLKKITSPNSNFSNQVGGITLADIAFKVNSAKKASKKIRKILNDIKKRDPILKRNLNIFKETVREGAVIINSKEETYYIDISKLKSIKFHNTSDSIDQSGELAIESQHGGGLFVLLGILASAAALYGYRQHRRGVSALSLPKRNKVMIFNTSAAKRAELARDGADGVQNNPTRGIIDLARRFMAENPTKPTIYSTIDPRGWFWGDLGKNKLYRWNLHREIVAKADSENDIIILEHYLDEFPENQGGDLLQYFILQFTNPNSKLTWRELRENDANAHHGLFANQQSIISFDDTAVSDTFKCFLVGDDELRNDDRAFIEVPNRDDVDTANRNIDADTELLKNTLWGQGGDPAQFPSEGGGIRHNVELDSFLDNSGNDIFIDRVLEDNIRQYWRNNNPPTAASDTPPIFILVVTRGGITGAQGHGTIFIAYNGAIYSIGFGYSGDDAGNTVGSMYTPDYMVTVSGTNSGGTSYQYDIVDIGLFKLKYLENLKSFIEENSTSIFLNIWRNDNRFYNSLEARHQNTIRGLFVNTHINYCKLSWVGPIGNIHDFRKIRTLNCVKFLNHIFPDRVNCDLLTVLPLASPRWCKRRLGQYTDRDLKAIFYCLRYRGTVPQLIRILESRAGTWRYVYDRWWNPIQQRLQEWTIRNN